MAEIRKTFGLKGEVLCYSLTDFPKLRFKKGNTFYLTNDKDDPISVILKGYRPSGDYCYLSFVDHDKIEDVEGYVHYYVCMDEADAPLPEGTIRLTDLYTCDVFDEEGNKLGHAVDLLDNCTTKTLRVSREKEPDFFVPWVKNVFIKEVDEKNHKVVIHVIPGMLE